MEIFYCQFTIKQKLQIPSRCIIYKDIIKRYHVTAGADYEYFHYTFRIAEMIIILFFLTDKCKNAINSSQSMKVWYAEWKKNFLKIYVSILKRERAMIKVVYIEKKKKDIIEIFLLH